METKSRSIIAMVMLVILLAGCYPQGPEYVEDMEEFSLVGQPSATNELDRYSFKVCNKANRDHNPHIPIVMWHGRYYSDGRPVR